MRKDLTSGLVIASAALVLASCAVIRGSGKSKTESRTVSGISSVAVAGSGEVSIQQTGTESLTITADDNILPDLTSDVVNGELRLGVKPGVSIQTNNPIQYYLTVKNLSGLTISGSADATMPQLQTNTLTLVVSGSGNAAISGLTTQSAQVTLSGSGEITLAGQTHSQNVAISGSGNYHGDQLASTSAVVQVTGSGNAKVRVSQTLNATVSGSGSVTYSGNPSQVSSHITGSGSVTQG
jgi:hypothetical protein